MRAALGCVVVGVLVATACGPKPPPTDPGPGGSSGSRSETEHRLRSDVEALEGDACAKAEWLADLVAKSRGLDAEVAEELKTEQQQRCRLQAKTDPDAVPADAGAGAAAPDPVPEVPVAPESNGACSRQRSEAELKAAGKKSDRRTVETAFSRCFASRIKACQLALDADVDEGITCWKSDAWPDVPEGTDPGAVEATAICMSELKVVVADLRKCAEKKKPAERDACISPYVGFAPQKCSLLDPDRAWRLFPGSAEVARLANADKQRAAENQARIAKETAEREARIAKETERCSGRTTLEYAERLKATPGPRTAVAGCKYEVQGKVVSRNNMFVQLVDATGTVIFLLRTRETFPEGQNITERTATFDSIEQAEMADGSARPFAVFKLDPPPPPKKK